MRWLSVPLGQHVRRLLVLGLHGLLEQRVDDCAAELRHECLHMHVASGQPELQHHRRDEPLEHVIVVQMLGVQLVPIQCVRQRERRWHGLFERQCVGYIPVFFAVNLSTG